MITSVAHSPMDDPTEMARAVSKLSDEQLQQIIENPSTQTELQAAKMELATRASESRGLASAYNMMPEQAPTIQATPQAPMVQAARGGIMGFKEEGFVEDPNKDILQQILDNQNDDEEGGTGDADQRALWNKRLDDAYAAQTNYQPSAPMTDAQRRANTKAYYQEVQDMAGPDPYKAQGDRIAEQEKQQAGDLRQQKGLAALAAIPAILQGGNAIRGIGAGAGAFGGMYGKALQADRAEKRALMSAKNNLEDAQYKMRVGLVGEARQLTAEGRRDKQAADAAHIAKQKALGEIAAKAVKLNAPAKAATRNFDIERVEAVAKNLRNTVPPNKGETPEQYDARIESMATFLYVKAKNAKEIDSTSNVTSNQMQDKGPGSLTTSAESTESTEMLAGVKAFEDLSKSYNKNARAIVKQFMDANGGDFAAAAQAYAKTRVTPKAATSGDGKSAPPKPASASSAVALPPGAPAGSTLGKKTSRGTEVIKDGKVIGYAN
jgi:hypothetical protein